MNSRRSFLGTAVAAMTLSSLASLGGSAYAEGTRSETQGDDPSRRAGEYLDDQTLETKVKTALIRNDQVKARNIEVEARDGVVRLSGHVDSSAEADSAVTTAQEVSGVKSVQSTLVLQQR